ncbi:MAG: cytidylate kinase-like family protein [Vulcanimicrobiaceae bacterium]
MIVTISNQYGTGAIGIAHRVAAGLSYTLVDRELPIVVAKRMRTTPEEVEAVEDSGRSLGERLLSSLEMSTPEVNATHFGESFDEECLREVQEAVREYASHGNVILIGRAAALILGRREDVVRVFMHAPRDWRIENVARDLQIERKPAQVEVDRIDRARKAHLRDWYDANLGDSTLYDLSIDTASFGEEGSASLIIAAVAARV